MEFVGLGCWVFKENLGVWSIGFKLHCLVLG